MGSIDFIKIINILSNKVEYTVESDGYEGDASEAVERAFKYLEKLI